MPVLYDARGYDTDKNTAYLRQYARHFAPLVDLPVRLLEIGIASGGSLRMWRDYFRSGHIVGLDVAPCPTPDLGDRIHTYRGAQQDTALLDRIARERAPDGFDIIIDDGSHIGWQAGRSFWHLFSRHLKPGGIFAIEDWGTGYWDDWPDGRSWDPPPEVADGARDWPSHAAGMVGFVKTLVDEVGVGDLTARGSTGSPGREPLISRLEILPGQVFVIRSDAAREPVG